MKSFVAEAIEVVVFILIVGVVLVGIVYLFKQADINDKKAADERRTNYKYCIEHNNDPIWCFSTFSK